MVKTTVYLPDQLKRRLEQAARVQRRSEAEIIREALERFPADQARPRPRLPLFSSGQVEPIEDWDEAMRGFDEREQDPAVRLHSSWPSSTISSPREAGSMPSSAFSARLHAPCTCWRPSARMTWMPREG